MFVDWGVFRLAPKLLQKSREVRKISGNLKTNFVGKKGTVNMKRKCTLKKSCRVLSKYKCLKTIPGILVRSTRCM